VTAPAPWAPGRLRAIAAGVLLVLAAGAGIPSAGVASGAGPLLGAATDDAEPVVTGWGDVHFGLRPHEILQALPGARMNRTLCDLRQHDPTLGRSDEKCERVEGVTYVGYVPFSVEVAFGESTGRARRILLRHRDPEQWTRRHYRSVLRQLEGRYGSAQPVLPLGATFADYCQDMRLRLRRGERIPPASLVPSNCELAHVIEARGGRISLQLCVREICPGSGKALTPAARGVVGLRQFDVEFTADRAPGEEGA